MYIRTQRALDVGVSVLGKFGHIGINATEIVYLDNDNNEIFSQDLKNTYLDL